MREGKRENVQTVSDAKGVAMKGLVTIRTIKNLSEYTIKVGKDKTGEMLPTVGRLYEGPALFLRRSVKKHKMTIVTLFINSRKNFNKYGFSECLQKNKDEIRIHKVPWPSKTFVTYKKEVRGETSDKMAKVGVGKAKRNHWWEERQRLKKLDGVATAVAKLLVIRLPTVAFVWTEP